MSFCIHQHYGGCIMERATGKYGIADFDVGKYHRLVTFLDGVADMIDWKPLETLLKTGLGRTHRTTAGAKANTERYVCCNGGRGTHLSRRVLDDIVPFLLSFGVPRRIKSASYHGHLPLTSLGTSFIGGATGERRRQGERQCRSSGWARNIRVSGIMSTRYEKIAMGSPTGIIRCATALTAGVLRKDSDGRPKDGIRKKPMACSPISKMLHA